MLAISTDYHDPAFNLALEEHLLLSLPHGHPGYFLLWRNAPSVIVGRHQCTLDEINAEYVKKTGLPVVRRITGGGAVYHDPGNLNFSFIFHCGNVPRPDLRPYMEHIRAALAQLGVQASINGRNDMEVSGRKISGNAQIVIGGRALVHGTLLVNVDLEKLSMALKPGASKIKSKGIASVRARVANLSDYWADGTTMASLKKCLVAYCADGIQTLEQHHIEGAHELADKKYRQGKWNFGQSPSFNLERRQRFNWGEIILRLSIRHNRIETCQILGDFFSASEIDNIKTRLQGCELKAEAIKSALAGLDLRDYFIGSDNSEVLEFFMQTGS